MREQQITVIVEGTPRTYWNKAWAIQAVKAAINKGQAVNVIHNAVVKQDTPPSRLGVMLKNNLFIERTGTQSLPGDIILWSAKVWHVENGILSNPQEVKLAQIQAVYRKVMRSVFVFAGKTIPCKELRVYNGLVEA